MWTLARQIDALAEQDGRPIVVHGAPTVRDAMKQIVAFADQTRRALIQVFPETAELLPSITTTQKSRVILCMACQPDGDPWSMRDVFRLARLAKASGSVIVLPLSTADYAEQRAQDPVFQQAFNAVDVSNQFSDKEDISGRMLESKRLRGLPAAVLCIGSESESITRQLEGLRPSAPITVDGTRLFEELERLCAHVCKHPGCLIVFERASEATSRHQALIVQIARCGKAWTRNGVASFEDTILALASPSPYMLGALCVYITDYI